MKARLVTFVIFSLVAASPSFAQNPRIVEWVESGPASDPDTIALGYPVPIPVDTPLPFAGFRSYSGLHMRHQDLAATTPWVHPHELGQTRNGRTIWAYRLGDRNKTTIFGAPEQAMLTNGGIHAREWQTPEVATGIIELLATTPDDDHLIAYLRDNANIIVIPVFNVDGFLQTQRYPSTNWLDTDPDFPETSPRDGRMRRKNMFGADENLNSQGDHRAGIDLNRNNNPFWATSSQSSSNPTSLIYHGAAPGSEPETQALYSAALLGPESALSMYTDLHSFSRVHFWARSTNNRLWPHTQQLLRNFSEFHVRYPAGKRYDFALGVELGVDVGIGTTDEYFTHVHQVPSWTLEIEPREPGSEYGGLARNGHDGFILPDAEVPRVRTELAETFAVAYYQQAGPPSMIAARLVDAETGSVLFEAEWTPSFGLVRSLYTYQTQPLQLDRDYILWVAHDKPMRWDQGGEAVTLPGQSASTMNVQSSASVAGTEITLDAEAPIWLGAPGGAPVGYQRYRYDAYALPIRFPASDENLNEVDGTVTATLAAAAADMTGAQTDADPSTMLRWEAGGWTGYEDSDGEDLTDSGGAASITFQLSSEDQPPPFVVEPGTSSAWYDPTRSGEGFMLEILPEDRAVMYWFTYDDAGDQDWFIAVGEVRGNRVLFPAVLQVSGGGFGPDFDPNAVSETVVGSASFIWSGCDSGAMSWNIGDQAGRMELQRLSTVMGVPCGDSIDPPLLEIATLSGSWYDPSHAGEGYTLEVLADQRLLVYWFGFDPDGNRRWFFGIGAVNGAVFEFDDMLTTTGGVFGDAFDPATVEELPWGSLELELSCEGGEARFTPTEAGFPPGTLDLVQLTWLDTLQCSD